MPELLDIGVVIPTRNAMPHICRHVGQLNEWISRVAEVVVVDSESNDGTVEYIRSNLKHDRIEYVSHPPGLYASWNEGISHVSSKFTYIATVGDCISYESLNRLYEVALSEAASVVLSPPVIVNKEGEALGKSWPIHRYIEQFVDDTVYELTALDRIFYSSLSLPGSLIGSSASNLYATSCLQGRPFSSKYGHAGDTAWAIGGDFKEKWILAKDVLSEFLAHEKVRNDTPPNREARVRLLESAAKRLQALKEVVGSRERMLVEHCLEYFPKLWLEREAMVVERQKLNSRKLPWFCSLSAWKLRQQKKELDGQIKKISRSLLNQYEALLTSRGS